MSYIEQTFCCEDFPACGHRATRIIDGCVSYPLIDDEPDAQAESIAEASVQHYVTKHGQYLCEDCAGGLSAAPCAHGACEACGRFGYLTHVVRTPKPRQEAVA